MKETGTIFDLVVPDIRDGQKGYMDIAKNAPEPKDDSFLNQVSDYAKTAVKGTIEGISRLGTSISPLIDLPTWENGKMKLPERGKEEQLQHQTEVLNEMIPTEEGFGQSALRRGLGMAPSMMAFPGSAAQAGTRSLIAGGAGEAAKEMDLPEWAQTAAELTAFIGPDITKKLLSSGKDKQLIAAAKKFGMTDEQITPLIQSEFKQKWLSKLAPKRGSTKKALESTKEALGEAYNNIQFSKEAKNVLPQEAQEKLFNSLTERLKDMPGVVRDLLIKDAQDLAKGPITGESIINFYKDINHHISGGAKQLTTLKQPIREALSSISPELGKDFENINSLFVRYYPIASRLKPNLVSDLISAGEALGILSGFTMGYTPSLYAILGEKIAKKASQQMLINPHLQQLSKKMVDAMNANKYGTIKKLTEAFSNQLRDEVPEASEILDDLSEEEIERFFKSQKKD